MAARRSRLQDLLRHRRWTPDQAATALDALDRSGEALEAFAARHGVHPSRLARWRRRQLPSRPELSFHEVVSRDVAATVEASPPSFLELTLDGGARLRFEASISAPRLAAIVRALEDRRSC